MMVTKWLRAALLLVVSLGQAFRFKSAAYIHHCGGRLKLAEEPAEQPAILRKVKNWACIKSCGACCKLGPVDSRPDLSSYLTPEELAQYLSMIGQDDWCVNFDQQSRMCKIYDTRPGFCRVDSDRFRSMFGIVEDDFVDFCRFCCKENIGDVYGQESKEMERFDAVQEELDASAVE